MLKALKNTVLKGLQCNTLNKIFFENLFFLLSTCVEHSSISCGTLMCLLSVGILFKTYIVSVYLGRALVTYLFSVYNMNIFSKI